MIQGCRSGLEANGNLPTMRLDYWAVFLTFSAEQALADAQHQVVLGVGEL